jgi:TP901 family phage tail tape measure protein
MANREVIADLVAQVSMDGTKFTTGMGKVSRQLRTVQEELKTARSRFKQTGDSTDFLGNKSETLGNKLLLQKSKLDLLNKSYQESKEKTGEFSKNTQNLATRLERANREFAETEAELKDVNAQLKTKNWDDVAKSAQNAGDKMQNAGRKVSSFGKSYTMGVTAPLVAGSVAVFKASSDFESAFAGVEKTVEGTEGQMKTLRGEIRNMAKDIPATTTEIAAVAEAAGQLGIQTEKVEKFTKTMVDLGESTNLSSDQAATTFARFANIVGMSQDDFDRLGSTVVNLGNNLATTESEITEMALRLAAAGKQVGLTEAEILGFSGALSSVGIEAEAGGTAFSKVMIDMSLAAEKGGDELDNFAKVAGVSASDFKKAYQEDAAGAITMFIEGLTTAEERGLSAIGILDEMGITEVRLRDTLLRAAGASDVFSGALEMGSKAWEENTALTEEASKRYATTESQLKILWNRVKDVAITLGDALVPAVMDAIDAAEPLIQKIEDGAQAFADMDEEQQQTILKFIAIAAAIGPASIAIGGMTTAAGGLMKMFGNVSSLLGKVGGVGLLARIGGLGIAGPVGLAIAGVGGLALGVYALSQNTRDYQEENLKKIETMQSDIEKTDELIKSFDDLKDKNELSTSQMLRYMDILALLEQTTAPDRIKELSDEQATLLGKSTLTNEEMEVFLGLNDTIIEKSPATKKSISSQGDAYAENTIALKEYNEEQRKILEADTRQALLDSVNEQKIVQEKLNELIKDAEEIDKERLANDEIRKQNLQNQIDQGIVISGLESEIATAEEDNDLMKAERLKNQLGLEKDNLQELIEQEDAIGRQGKGLTDKYTTNQENLDISQKELAELENIRYKFEEIILAQSGINYEKGKGLDAVQKEISKLEEQKKKLDDLHRKGELNTQEYEDQSSKIDTQIGKLRDAEGELVDINALAGKTIYKNLYIRNQSEKYWNDLNAQLKAPISKPIQLKYQNIYSGIHKDIPQYASGTRSHSGGLAIAGEAGWELARFPNGKMTPVNEGVYNFPTGTQIFPHEKSKEMVTEFREIPQMAVGGTITSNGPQLGQYDQLGGNQSTSLTGQAVIYTTVINQVNGREVSREIYKDITELQERDKRVRESFAT